MKRYLVFGGQCFYARGGFKDLIADAQTASWGRARALEIIAEAQSPGSSSEPLEWWHVVDLHTGEIVDQSDETPLGSEASAANAYNMMFMGGYLVPEAIEVPNDD